MKQTLPSSPDGAIGSRVDRAPLAEQILERFERLPRQLQAAARYVLDRPEDVALLSMRDQARRAGVLPATMTRLAKRMGLAGYEDVRTLYAEAVRERTKGFSGRARVQVESQKLKGDRALAAEMVASFARQIGLLESLVDAASLLAAGRRIYCTGLRASYPVAWHFHYILSLSGGRILLVDAAGGTGTDRLRELSQDDVLLAVSVAPYTRTTLDVARYAASRGIGIIALTDSEASPLAQLARHTVLVSTDSPSFFHSMAPAFAAVEIIAALLAGRGGTGALDALGRTGELLAAFGVHAMPRPLRNGTRG